MSLREALNEGWIPKQHSTAEYWCSTSCQVQVSGEGDASAQASAPAQAYSWKDDLNMRMWKSSTDLKNERVLLPHLLVLSSITA